MTNETNGSNETTDPNQPTESTEGGAPLIRVVNGKRQFLRLTFLQRIQHFFLASSVLALIFTGMPLKFHDRDWAPYLEMFLGGVATTRTVHRVAGIVLVTLFVYHVFYLATNIYRGEIAPLIRKRELTPFKLIKLLITQPLVPNFKDAWDFIALMKYLLYMTNERPKGDKFRWIEKFDYWAPGWGMVVIGLSGLLMFDIETASHLMPGSALNFALIAHSEEALLAALFLFVWHWYNVHYSPAVFPQSLTYITGYQPEELMREEHYLEYVRVMKVEGLEAEILPPHGGDEHPEPTRFSLWSITHTLFFGLMVAYLITVVWHETFAHIAHYIEEQHHLAEYRLTLAEAQGEAGEAHDDDDHNKPELPALDEGELSLDELLAVGEFGQFDLRERVFQARQGANSFHQVDARFAKDSRSGCIACHGEIPHNKAKERRAFLNMHASFLACESCHMRLDGDERTGVYKWYSRVTGEIVEDAEVGLNVSALTSKIIPFERQNGELRRVDTDARIAFAQDYLERSRTEDFNEAQQSMANQALHKFLSEEPYSCESCHPDEDPVMNYEKLGYSVKRIDVLIGNEMARMVTEDEPFLMPKDLFDPGEEAPPEE